MKLLGTIHEYNIYDDDGVLVIVVGECGVPRRLEHLHATELKNLVRVMLNQLVVNSRCIAELMKDLD